MKTRRTITFLLIYVVITFLWLWYERRYTVDKHVISRILQLPAIWVFPILMIAIGLILSRLYSYFKRTTDRYFVLGQLACIAITFLLFIYTFISDRKHEKQYGNFEYNRATRDYTYYPADSAYQRKAFDALESNFSDKNSFRITDLISDDKDTVINSVPTKFYVAWFEYYQSKEPNKFLCAKYYVSNDTVINAYLNEEVTRNFDFTKRKAFKDSLIRVVDSLSD